MTELHIQKSFLPYENITQNIVHTRSQRYIPECSTWQGVLGWARAQVRVTARDFAGQKIYNVTRQYFMAKQAMYMVVRGWAEEEEPTPPYPAVRVS